MSSVHLTATTESNPQVIAYWTAYSSANLSWYWRLQCVAWISQQKYDSNGNYSPKTTIKYKWRIYQYNYYPYWNDSHEYMVKIGNTESKTNFKLPQSQSNGTRDMCTAKTLGTFSHNTSTGEYSATIRFTGYKCGGVTSTGASLAYTSFDDSKTITVPTITPPEPDPPTPPEPEPEPPTPIVEDNDPRYYIYADGELVYAAGIEGYEIINPKLTLEVNKAGSLTFDIPIGSAMYNKLNLLKTTIDCRQGNDILFRGRVLSSKRSIYNTLTYYCEGFLSWLVDMSSNIWSRSNVSARDMLKQMFAWYNERASANRQITYEYSDISATISFTVEQFTNYWEVLQKVFINGVGGYFVPYLTESETGIQWLSTYGNTSQVIQFGENLLDFSEYIDASNVFTVVRPYGKEVNGSRIQVTGEFIADDDAVATFGHIERVAIFDDITTASALASVATTYLRLGTKVSTSLSISAVDLHLLNPSIDRIHVGDSVRVVSVPHEVDAYFMCTKAVIDLQNAKNTVYTLGSTQRTISELTDSSVNKYVIAEGE